MAAVWYDKEIEYLQILQAKCAQLSLQQNELYKITHSKQTRLRIPSILLSSFSGIASFGTTSFPLNAQKWVSIGVGIINIGIAMLQTYESYLKIADTVTKSLTAAAAFKKLGDDIDCELYIPIENRKLSGEAFVRDCFSRYQAIVADAPPLAVDEDEMQEKLDKLVAEPLLSPQPPLKNVTVIGDKRIEFDLGVNSPQKTRGDMI